MHQEAIQRWQDQLRWRKGYKSGKLIPLAPQITDDNLQPIPDIHFRSSLFDMIEEIGHLEPLNNADLPYGGGEPKEVHEALAGQWESLRSNPAPDAAILLLHDMAQHGIYEIHAGSYPDGRISSYTIGKVLYAADVLPQDQENIHLLAETLAALEYNTALLMRNRAVAEWDRGGRSHAIDVKVESTRTHLERYNEVVKHLTRRPFSVKAVTLFFPYGPPRN
ncbi:MAG: hypothetical protein WC489_04240 [Patescibacteria group bacterium]